MAATDNVVLVDADDVAIGTAEKLDAHRRGLKHRAISALIHNSAGEFLLQRRSLAKYHSGGLWTNACCSHPYPGESAADAAKRRLTEEMGITCPLKPLFRFSYRADVPGGLIENEVAHVFGGMHDGPIVPDPAEVDGYKWIALRDLDADMLAKPEAYTVWFRQYVGAHGALIAEWIERGARALQ
ncbi:MAG TPA: isopentenyl-diphosphate Delta-isomerase [Xanthobacteraceae bacterium]|nr:isopentenyl-diphosphate Delta-isomerase [Xanthobacteraceae bacterium]